MSQSEAEKKVHDGSARELDDDDVLVIEAAVISHRDPGKPNWVETAGHKPGTMCWRWIGADEHPLLNVRVVRFADL